jgi:hypothetical protein
MKKIEIDRFVTTKQKITIEVTDENLFKKEVLGWYNEEGVISLWDLEEPYFTSISNIDFSESDIYDEDEDLVYYALEKELNIDFQK